MVFNSSLLTQGGNGETVNSFLLETVKWLFFTLELKFCAHLLLRP